MEKVRIFYPQNRTNFSIHLALQNDYSLNEILSLVVSWILEIIKNIENIYSCDLSKYGPWARIFTVIELDILGIESKRFYVLYNYANIIFDLLWIKSDIFYKRENSDDIVRNVFAYWWSWLCHSFKLVMNHFWINHDFLI